MINGHHDLISAVSIGDLAQVGHKIFPHLKLTFGTNEPDELLDKVICDKETAG